MSTQQRVLKCRVQVQDPPVSLPAGKVVLVMPDRSDMYPTHGHLEVWIQAETTPARSVTTDLADFVPTALQQILTVGTGMEVPEGAEHVGSSVDGPFVWHLYRLPETAVKS